MSDAPRLANAADWIEANGRYVTAAVAWLRSRLLEHTPTAPIMAGPMPSPAPPRGFWRRASTILPTSPRDGLILIGGADAGGSVQGRKTLAAIEEAMSPPPMLVQIAGRMGLSAFEQDLLLLCCAMELDTSIGPLCAGVLQDARRAYPTFGLALAVFDDPAWEALSPARPLRHWRLIDVGQGISQSLVACPLRADERIVNALRGVAGLDERLAPLLSPVINPGRDIPRSQARCAESLLHALSLRPQNSQPPVVQLLGSDADSKRIIAGYACVTLGRALWQLDAALLPTSPAELDLIARLWQRETLLSPAALYVEIETADPAQNAHLEKAVARFGGLVFVAVRTLQTGSGLALSALVEKPTRQEQLACWQTALAPDSGERALALAGQFGLNADMINDIAQREVADPVPDATGHRLWDACRALTRPRLDTLAQRIIPRATWDDIVLPPTEHALLKQIAAQIGQRDTVYTDWGFGKRSSRGLGIAVLFAGASGSGKTMAAEVLANDLRLDLFRVDLSAVVSKYIGETETNLRRLFDAAEDGGAILLFDEADALFGKRSEVKQAHDRYANIEIDYLLQRMEAYGGLAVLATNMKTALDPAFLRRLRFVVDFPFPGVAERKLMWAHAFPPETPVDALDLDRLARLNLTGGHIAVIALNAAFAAASSVPPNNPAAVTMPIVLNAARIEFRKLGRTVNEADFRWLPAEIAASSAAA